MGRNQSSPTELFSDVSGGSRCSCGSFIAAHRGAGPKLGVKQSHHASREWQWVKPRSHGLTFTWWGCYGVCFGRKPTELAHPFLFCSCVCFCLDGHFDCISFHNFSRQVSAFSLCSSGRISPLLVLSTIYFFMKAILSPDITHYGWQGLKHQTN